MRFKKSLITKNYLDTLFLFPFNYFLKFSFLSSEEREKLILLSTPERNFCLVKSSYLRRFCKKFPKSGSFLLFSSFSFYSLSQLQEGPLRSLSENSFSFLFYFSYYFYLINFSDFLLPFFFRKDFFFLSFLPFFFFFYNCFFKIFSPFNFFSRVFSLKIERRSF